MDTAANSKSDSSRPGFLEKALRVIRAENRSTRIWAVVNKSPAWTVMRKYVDLRHAEFRKPRVEAAEKLILTEEENAALEGIRRNGYVELKLMGETPFGLSATHPVLLKNLGDFAEEKLSRIDQVPEQKANDTKKKVWVRLSNDEIPENGLTATHPLVAFTIQDTILKIVAKYLGEAGFLRYVLLTHSLPMEGRPQSSQLWHLDRDDRRMLKVFVYCTDVESEADGPFTFIDAQESEKVQNSFFMRHLDDDEVFGPVDPKRVTKLVRPKYSVFILDTSRCYHMGSRVGSGHHRILFTALFTAMPSIYPLAKLPSPIGLTENLSELQLLSLRERPQSL
jgi:hypothetical protein